MLRTTANANVINRGGPGNLWNVRGGMKQHDEFLMLMADRAHRYFFNGGMLTSERLRADVNALADEVRLPVIAETARWGRQGGRYTPDVWEQSVAWMLDRFAPENGTDRTATVLSQLRRADVYPDIDAPEYTVNGTRQHGGPATADDMIDFVASAGTVYYTLDGSDPRLTGGAINPEALVFDGAPFRIGESKVVKSRLLNNDEWSALSEAEFVVDTVPADATSLRITEVNFHPANPTDAEIEAGHGDGDDFEFVELMNISEQSIDLSEVRFQFSDVDGNEQGIEFAFGQGSITRLAPGERVLVVEDISAFVARYGGDMPVAGQWSGGLSNRSEQITLRAGESVIHQFTYSDEWYAGTDGVGRTLEIASATQSLELWGERSGWRESATPGGSPGSEGEVNNLPGDANRDGIFNSADLILIFQASEFEDDIDGNSTWEEGDWDGDGDFTTSDLVEAFKLGHYSAEAKQNSNRLNDDAMRSLFAASQDDKAKSARI